MNPIKDLVSIIMPVYNASLTIKASLDSIMAQTYKEWELIMVNDASTDNSKAIVEPYLKKDKRFKWIDMKQNSGLSKTRNLAIDRGCGQYIAFLDADATWDSTKLEKQLNFMRTNAYAFTFTGYRSTKGRIVKADSVLNTRQLIVNNTIGCLTVMLDRRSLGDFIMPDYQASQDYLTWLMFMKQGFKAYGLNEILATTTEESITSLTAHRIKCARSQWENYRNALGLGYFKSGYYFIHYVYYSFKFQK